MLPQDQPFQAEIARQLEAFAGPMPEWWAYLAAHDWVALCQLYGPMTICLRAGRSIAATSSSSRISFTLISKQS